MASIAIQMASSLTYYYKQVEPGTYMYHCHVEAAEHMQMGMLGNLFVLPAQDGTSKVYGGKTYTKFVYNDGDGSTGYNKGYFLQETAFDPNFHYADHTYNPLDLAGMNDTYLMLNGRSYPDTIDPNPIVNVYGNASQPIPALITATAGQKILIRLSSLSTVDFSTVTVLGIPMQVVGQGARLLRGPTGTNTYYTTGSVTLG